MRIAYILISWMYTITIASAGWTLVNDSNLNSAGGMLGAAILNNSLHVFSAFSNDEYEKNGRDSITYIGSTATGCDCFIWGQWWTQSGEMVYLLNGESTKLSVFNLLTKQWTNEWGVAVIYDTSYYGCLASSDTYVYVVGGRAIGGLSLKNIQILDLSTYVWEFANPKMKVGRDSGACVVGSNYLWAFAGGHWISDTRYLHSSAERLWLKGTLSLNAFAYVDDLTNAATEPRAVAFGDEVYVIGGYSSAPLDTVHIYAADGSVTLSLERLPYAHYAAGVIIQNNVIYVFGGSLASGYSNQWMYFEIATEEPTGAPTTGEPSVAPTKTPTKYPTETPSKAPTNNPSVAPSEMPSKTPTKNPSKAPTQTPSKAPTNEPSSAPSRAPSDAPSKAPSDAPSQAPILIITTMDAEKGEDQRLFSDTIITIFIGGVCIPILLITIFCIANHKEVIKKYFGRITSQEKKDDVALQNALQMDAQMHVQQMDAYGVQHENAENVNVQSVNVQDEEKVPEEGGELTVEGKTSKKATIVTPETANAEGATTDTGAMDAKQMLAEGNV